jgi:uncharacterized protein (TIGR02271 family)
MSYEKVVAVYDTAAHADAAVIALKAAGYPAADISVIRNEGDAAKAGLNEPGFWQRLFGKNLGLYEAGGGRSVQRGSVVVAVRILDSEAPSVIKVLDAHQPVDILDRARSRAETPKIVVPPPTSGTAFRKDEEVVRLAEEQLNVGKRQVESGKTRLRRFIVERPVEATVTLHEQHAEVIRRAISDPNFARDIDWSEEIIEVTETIEEPVISKTARVTEEVVVRNQGSDHVETIHDTVRRQQLEVERVPAETVKK